MAKHRWDDTPFECLVKGHDWVKNGWTGRQNDNWDEKPYRSHTHEIQHYNCSRHRGAAKYELLNWDRELSREERMREILRYNAGTRAMMWLLDGEDSEDESQVRT